MWNREKAINYMFGYSNLTELLSSKEHFINGLIDTRQSWADHNENKYWDEKIIELVVSDYDNLIVKELGNLRSFVDWLKTRYPNCKLVPLGQEYINIIEARLIDHVIFT